MELSILHAIQSIQTPWLNDAMKLIFNTIVGDKGQMWVYLGVLLFIIPKTRKCGICMLTSYLLSYFVGDAILKDLIARPRPFMVDETVELLVKKSSSYSCPSVHSAIAFGSSMALFGYYRKPGIVALIFSAFVAFSRLYFFVHYPTDVIFGAIIGLIIGYLVVTMMKKIK